MIKVQFDHQTFSMHRFGGISRYFATIQQSLLNEPDFSIDRGILYTTNYYLRKVNFPMPKWLGRMLLKDYETKNKWNKRYSKLKIKKNDFDIFHPTYYNPYYLRKLNGPPVVLTVHDMIHELFPEYFPAQDDTMQIKRISIESADHFIAVSQATANDLQRLYNIPPEKVSVIHHGFYPSDTIPDYTPHFENYLLFVGDRGGYKNFFRFLDAVAGILIENNINLICAGGKPFSRAEQEVIRRLKIDNRVIHTSPSDGQLNHLYAKAILFVYPSLYEGFGLPILEAFNNNCPVAVSETSCFAEVGGNAVAYFDPYDVDSMSKAIAKIVTNPAKADSLRLAGKQQLKKFPLKLCMEKTMDVYRHVAAQVR